MVHLKVYEIVNSKMVLQSKRDFKSGLDLADEIDFFQRMVATKWKLVITFD